MLLLLEPIAIATLIYLKSMSFPDFHEYVLTNKAELLCLAVRSYFDVVPLLCRLLADWLFLRSLCKQIIFLCARRRDKKRKKGYQNILFGCCLRNTLFPLFSLLLLLLLFLDWICVYARSLSGYQNTYCKREAKSIWRRMSVIMYLPNKFQRIILLIMRIFSKPFVESSALFPNGYDALMHP